MTKNTHYPAQISPLLIHLLKGVLYQENQPEAWRDLLTFQAAVRDYFAIIGLKVVIDETEGYAFLRQEAGDAENDDTPPLPRLIQRRPLSYPLSLLCVLLRKRLVEQDAAGGETRLILGREQIIDMLHVFLPQKKNEAQTIEQINSLIKKVVDLGFLRRLKGDEDRFEVRRIIKALVDADWLRDLDNTLREYRAHADRTS